MMTFQEAVEICKDFGGGRLLEGLEWVRDHLDREREEEDYIAELTSEERMAYYLVVQQMRPLFV